MALFSVHSFRPLPGRGVDLLTSMVEAKRILDANGAICSVWQPIAGGEAGTLSFVHAYSGLREYGRAQDRLRTNGEWQAFLIDKVMTNPSATNVENFQLADVDASEGLPTEPSTVLFSTVFRTNPGCLLQHLTAQATARAHLTRLGGRVRTVSTTGRDAGCYTTLIGFEDYEHYAEFGEKLAVDEMFQSFWIEVNQNPPAHQTETQVAALVELPA